MVLLNKKFRIYFRFLVKEKIQRLISGKTIKELVDEHIVFGDLKKNASALWSILFMSGDAGIIIEFKAPKRRNKVEAEAKAARQQIETQDYAMAMRSLGIENVIKLGVAFFGKRVIVCD